MNPDDDPDLTGDELDHLLARRVVTFGCEHMAISTTGAIEPLALGCGCQAAPIIGNVTVSAAYL